MWERDGLPSWIPEVKLCNTLIFQDNLSLMKIKHKFKLRGFLSFFFFYTQEQSAHCLPYFYPKTSVEKCLQNTSLELLTYTPTGKQATSVHGVGWHLLLFLKQWSLSGHFKVVANCCHVKTSMVRKFIRTSKTNS